MTIFFQELSKIFNNNNIDQYGRNEDKVLKCTNIPSDIDSIHNRRPKPSFGDICSTARGPRHPPFSKKKKKKD